MDNTEDILAQGPVGYFLEKVPGEGVGGEVQHLLGPIFRTLCPL